MAFLPLAVSHEPRAVFDVRDWYLATFGNALRATVGGAHTPAVVRPAVLPTITAEPSAFPAASPITAWHFTNALELVTRPSRNGVLAFFGRLRVISGPLLDRRRLGHQAVQCRLTIRAPGYLPRVIDPFVIPDANSTRAEHWLDGINPIELYPAPDYPFPRGPLANGLRAPTLLEGIVRQPDGAGIPDVRVDIPVITNLLPVSTDADGRWLLALNDPETQASLASPQVFRFTLPNGQSKSHRLRFDADRRNAIPETSIRGRFRFADGRSVVGATLEVKLRSSGQFRSIGAASTGADGGVAFYFDIRLPLPFSREDADDLSEEVRVTMTVPGQPAVPVPLLQIVHYGQMNDLGTITLSPPQ